MDRKEFEKLPNIRHWISSGRIRYNEEYGEYEEAPMFKSTDGYALGFINGAWWIWCENKKGS